jgi:predicted RNA-binding Zn ribbon-like protein
MPASATDMRRADSRDRLPGPVPPRTRLWLDFVNTDAAAQMPGGDLLRDFEALLAWLKQEAAVDEERAAGIRRRAVLQPAAAAAALVDARRVRAALRALAERGDAQDKVREDAVIEINRVLGRSAGTRRLDPDPATGGYVRNFVPTGDAFAGLMIPIVESAADSLIGSELPRVRRCADPRCHRVFLDGTKNGLRRWCDMGTCGNRAKAARHRARHGDAK